MTAETKEQRRARETAAYYARGRRRREKAAETGRRKKYIEQVRHLTKKADLAGLPGVELRGKGFCLDHRVSCLAAYLAGWPPERAAALGNLQVLPTQLNRAKGVECWSSLDFGRPALAAQ